MLTKSVPRRLALVLLLLATLATRGVTQTVTPPTGEEIAQRALTLAAEQQKREDTENVTKRPKRNMVESEATFCIGSQTNTAPGAFYNRCPFKVRYWFCNVGPAKGSYSEYFDCDQGKHGIGVADSVALSPAHTRHADLIFWAACKAPATPVDVKHSASGLLYRCR